MRNGDTEGSSPLPPEGEASGGLGPHKTAECPDEERIRMLVPGLVGPAEAEKLLAHAAGCPWCITVLREATQDLKEPATEEEERLASQSKFANPRQRRKLAKQLAYQSREAHAARPFRGLRLPVAVGAALAVTALAGAVYQQWSRGATHTAALLGRAYALRRQMDGRVPGAEYGQKHAEMGTVSSRFDSPVPLSEAIANIQRAIQKHPDDPRWLQLEGRADLLDNQEDSAIAKLARARALRPRDAGILTDLGAAHLQKAEKDGEDPKEYSTAFDLFSEGARLQPGDPVLLFNLALAGEHIYALDRAQAAWNRYLELDSNSPWAAEARRHLEQLKKK